MSLGINTERLSANLKKTYAGLRIPSIGFKQDPFLSNIKIKTDCSGISESVPVIHADPQGRSATFADAQDIAKTSSHQGVQFEIRPKRNYHVIRIDGMYVRQMRKDAGAFMTRVRSLIDGAIRQLGRDAAINMYRTGWGGVARASNPGANTTLAFVEPGAARLFEQGARIQGVQTLASGVLKASGAVAEVVATNYSANTVALDVNANTIFANNDYVVFRGDRENSLTPAQRKLSGLEDWVLESAPGGSDNFNGVNRSGSSRLWGNYYDGTNESIVNALINGVEVVTGNGGEPDVGYVSTAVFRDLTILFEGEYKPCSAGSKAMQEAGIGVRGIEVMVAGRYVKLYPSNVCQSDVVWLLDGASWSIKSWGPFMSILDDSGSVMMTVDDADGIEIRVGHYADMACDAPGHNLKMRVKV